MKKTILLTGGTGFIGSHTAVELLADGFHIIIVDDLSNSTIEVLDGIEKISGKRPEFIKLDLRDFSGLERVFESNKIDGIIHFAAKKAVGESVIDPLLYYDVNLNTLLNLLTLQKKYAIHPIVFSSSCTVYGQPDELPVTEETPFKKAESPYGNTKQIGEEILKDACTANPSLRVVSLRYFNPVGAHNSALIGELPNGVPQNLVPYVTQTAAGIRKELLVYGGDYPTRDGTAIRDYIHVVDLAKAHVLAIHRLLKEEMIEPMEIYNLGTGKGSTVLEVIQAFEESTGIKLNYRITDRRPGDVVATYADTTKANEQLGWNSIYTLQDMMRSSWAWQLTLK